MAKQINLDGEFNLTKVRTAGQLVLTFLNRAYEIWRYLPIEKKRTLMANSVTFRGIAKLKKSLDRFGGMGDGD